MAWVAPFLLTSAAVAQARTLAQLGLPSGGAVAVARDEATLPLAFEPNEGQSDPRHRTLPGRQGPSSLA